MKKRNFLILFAIFALLFSCETDTSEFESDQTEAVLVVGEIKNMDTEGRKNLGYPFINGGLLNLCSVSGALCASPNQTRTYTYSTPDNNPSITWTVNSGNITIIGGQGTDTVTLSFGSSFSGGQISVEGIGPLNCVVTRNILSCGGPGPVGCNTYQLGILDEYIDGTQSGSDAVYLMAGGNFPSGTTYEWQIRRQNGSTQFYSASTSNPRLVVASINNRITRATVTAKFQDCEKTVTNTFDCAIPNADSNGYLFPECGGNGNGGGFGGFGGLN